MESPDKSDTGPKEVVVSEHIESVPVSGFTVPPQTSLFPTPDSHTGKSMLSGDSHFAVNSDTKSENPPDSGDFASSVFTSPSTVTIPSVAVTCNASSDTLLVPNAGDVVSVSTTKVHSIVSSATTAPPAAKMVSSRDDG